MDVEECMASGIIDRYCLGFTSAAEDVVIRELAKDNPFIQQEIDAINASLESVIKQGVLELEAASKKVMFKKLKWQQLSSFLQKQS